jgi:hypothetical protein
MSKTPYHDAFLLPTDIPTRWDVFRKVGYEWRDWLWRQTDVFVSHAKLAARQLGCETADVLRCLMHPEIWSLRVRPIVMTMRTLLIEDLTWTDTAMPQQAARIAAALEPWVALQGSDWRHHLDLLAARHVAGLREFDPSAGVLDNKRAIRRILLGVEAILKYHPGWLGVTSGVARAFHAVVK